MSANLDAGHGAQLTTFDLPASATRWPRYFARIFDLCWESLVLAVPVGFVLVVLGYDEAWLDDYWGEKIFEMLLLPFALMLDAWLYRWRGNTPGKALLGLKVTNREGGALSFRDYLRRNLKLGVSGVGLMLPLVILFTLARQSRRVRAGEPASYDETSGDRVAATPVGRQRMAVFALLFAGLVVLTFWM